MLYEDDGDSHAPERARGSPRQAGWGRAGDVLRQALVDDAPGWVSPKERPVSAGAVTSNDGSLPWRLTTHLRSVPARGWGGYVLDRPEDALNSEPASTA